MKETQPDLFGTDPKFLHRAEGPETSVVAAYEVDTSRREREVLEVIALFDQGAISDQVRASFPANTPYSSMTARYAALDRKGMIRRSRMDTRPGKSRKPQMVMRVTTLGLSALKK
jgi:hypothetical protein